MIIQHCTIVFILFCKSLFGAKQKGPYNAKVWHTGLVQSFFTERHNYASVKYTDLTTQSVKLSAKSWIEDWSGQTLAIKNWGHVNDKHANLYWFNNYNLLHSLLLHLKLYKQRKHLFTKSVCASMIFVCYFLSLSTVLGMHRNELWYNMLTKLKTISEIETLQYLHVK